MILLMFLLSLLFCSSFCQPPDYDSCKLPATTWSGKEVTKAVKNITSFEDCAKVCEAAGNCNYFTWNNEHHSYFQNSCFLFSSPVEQEKCEGCISGPLSCFCDLPVACMDNGRNLLDIIPNDQIMTCE